MDETATPTPPEKIDHESASSMGADPGAVRASFPIVAVGASAGGLKAFKELLSGLSDEPGMALVLIQHLDPHAESILPEILNAVSPLPVVRAADSVALERNLVYVTPPNTSLEVVWGRLRLTPRDQDSRPFMPVDILMRSLAHDAGSRAVGVVLSGSGTDGTIGLQAIKDANGITFAQDEESASFHAMPRSAIAAGCVDAILPPEEIARELVRIGHCAYMNQPHPDEPVSSSGRELGEPQLHAIFDLLHASHGIDFSRYKQSTILRRIRRRMVLRRIERADEYIRTLREDPQELSALYQDFLIRVTSFFRDPEVFDTLKRDIIPQLLKDRPADSPIRVWVAGCASGEEVYSIAMTLLECLGASPHLRQIKILATDVNERALEVARAGCYIENIALDVSPERLRRFFVRTESGYQISKVVRDMCVFSRHDVTRDPPFARLDLISCRNLLIYLDLPAQKRVLPLFHYGLNPDGYLMLGPSETIGSFGDLFAPVNNDSRIFARKASSVRPLPSFEPTASSDSRRTPSPTPSAVDTITPDLQREADRALLARYAPTGVLIDDDLRILQFRGRTEPFLRPAPGSPSLNLLKMAHEGLMPDLHAAIGQARAEGAPVRRPAIRLDFEGRPEALQLTVLPLRLEAVGGPYYLVLFEHHPQLPDQLSTSRQLSPQSEAETASLGVDDARHQVVTLRRELDATRDYLQSVIEEYETTTEELKSANEEILSSNEELQSTNEELQTAKEEMQSTNEELQTVNEELNHRILELGRSSDDLLNLVSSVNIPIVMVGRDLHIRRYTPSAEPLLNLIPTDIGRPIGDLRSNLDLNDLDRRIAQVIDSLSSQELEAKDRDGRAYSVRIRPYITTEKKIDGAVVALVDIDQIKRVGDDLRRALDNAESIIETVWQPLIVLDGSLTIQRTNAAFEQTFHLSRRDVEGRPLPLLDGGKGPWSDPQLADDLRKVSAEGRPLKGRELDAEFGPLGQRTFLYNASPIAWKADGAPMILLALEDITERKREIERDRILVNELSARVEAERANRKKDEFLAMLAHELRNPLSPVLNALLVLRSPGSTPSDHEWATQIMERQVRHMARLLDDLLDVSRVMRGSIELRKEPIDLRRVAEHVIDGVRSLVRSRKHELTVALPPDPVPLVADPVRIEQILTNLLHNAAKYTPEGGQIRLSIDREDTEALIRVQDNGIGIAPEQLREVFELFMQVDSSLDRSLGGLGIGLTLVKNLVELHGGSIEARSAGEGLGSEFLVRLPIAAHLPSAPATDDDPDGEIPPRRLLLVDDNLDALRTLELLLRRMGHEVYTALDGPTALEMVREVKPDLVLLDLGLPGMDGFEVARRLRADPETRSLPLVALSGYGQEQDRRQSRNAGFDEHAVKPIDLDHLQQLLRLRRP